MMTLPPLRTGSCIIGRRRYPAIIGEAKGTTLELFVCGLHVDRFIRTLPPAELREFLQRGIEVRADGGGL
jgi:hypothetical protein